MRLLIGLTAVFASLAMAAMTVVSIKSAGGIDVLSIVSFFVVILLGLAGFGALRSDR